MQAYYPSSAAHSHAVIPIVPTASMQAYHPSTAAHSFTVPTGMQAYYPSTAAHTHLSIPNIPTTNTPPSSPTAAELIASLQNPEDLSDDELLKRARNAQTTLAKWQNEYLENDREIRRATTGLFNKRNEPKALQLQDPKEYERSRDKAALEATTTQETSSRGRKLTKTTNAMPSQPAKQPVPKTRKPKTTIPKVPQAPKTAAATSSKPKTTIPDPPQAPKLTTATSSKPRAPRPARSKTPKPTTTTTSAPKPRRPTRSKTPNPTTTPTTKPKPPPPTRRQPRKPTTTFPPTAATHPLTIPKDLLIDMNGPQPASTTGKRTCQPRKMFDADPLPAPKAAISRSATPAPTTKKRARTVEGDEDGAPAGAKRSKGDVMREVWARRQAEGRNGRHGGAPKVATVTKARGKVGGGK